MPTVIGPTPPGTGVMKPAFSFTPAPNQAIDTSSAHFAQDLPFVSMELDQILMWSGVKVDTVKPDLGFDSYSCVAV